MTTHYMDEAEVCDNIAIIDNGNIIAMNSPEELKKVIGGDVIYLKTRDNAKAKDEIKSALDIDASIRDGELFISTVKGDTCIPELIRTLGDSVLSVRLQRPTLNDVF